jgi:hypothetical protein
MGGDSLDARLQPIAEALLMILVLAAVAAIASLIINHVARRRREQKHNKVSGSRRGKHTKSDLFTKTDPTSQGSSGNRKRGRERSSSEWGINILEDEAIQSSPNDSPSAPGADKGSDLKGST